MNSIGFHEADVIQRDHLSARNCTMKYTRSTQELRLTTQSLRFGLDMPEEFKGTQGLSIENVEQDDGKFSATIVLNFKGNNIENLILQAKRLLAYLNRYSFYNGMYLNITHCFSEQIDNVAKQFLAVEQEAKRHTHEADCPPGNVAF